MSEDLYYDAVERLKEATSKRDWDAYDAQALPTELWDDARRIAGALHEIYGKCSLSPAADGSVHLSWVLNGKRFHLEVYERF